MVKKNMKYSMKEGSRFISIVGMRLGMIVIVTGILRPAVNDYSSLPAAGTFSTQIILFFLPFIPYTRGIFCLWIYRKFW